MILLSSLVLSACISAGPEWYSLSSLDLSPMRQGWGSPARNMAVEGKPMTLGGRKLENGVGTHAPSTMWLELGGKADRFTATVGVDDEVMGKPGSVVFKVLADGRTLFDSGVMKPGMKPKQVDLDLTGLSKMLLIVTDAGDSIDFDHADWGDAKILASAAPRTMNAPAEERVVLTPKPSPKPRINGAMAWGVRPGSPVLYTIAATGERPIEFKADGLPDGVSLDAKTGRLSGSIAEAGEYPVVLHAKNTKGEAERTLMLVCGETLALTPHMGWNSWYVWENHVTDASMRAAADAMVSTGMIDHGYMYVNIDDCWAIKPGAKDPLLSGKERDERGRINANGRFPDMKGLTDYIHSKGLKAGIYTSPGKLTCAGFVGTYQHEADDAARFAEWGFDFLKYDWCSYEDVSGGHGRAELRRPYELMAKLLKDQPRDLVLNLCQYGMGNVWEWGKEVGGHSWRTAGDLGGSFEGIASAMFRDGFGLADRAAFSGPGGWNDPDYLLLGYISNWKGSTSPTPLTPNEQYTHVSLWCLLGAPLIFSGDMTRLDEFTLGLLTNDDLIDVDQDVLGRAGSRVARDEATETEVWAKPLSDGSVAVGLFNRGEFEGTVDVKWRDVGLSGSRAVRDLWRQKDLGQFADGYEAKVPRHGCVVIRVK